ncbi:hypothetical protein ACIP5Y_14620 [Nocardia sp. NPDC088792]|uniref:hypothetical protein n=1 Tax=Nocardia sp. NPDC088792 TaxID=3364332 RepID=UPI003828421E
MRTPKTACTALLLGTLTAAAMIAASPPAGAQTFEFPSVPSLLRDGLCGTNIRTWANTDPQWPGRAIINMQALPVIGIGPGDYSFAPQCEALTTVAWRNLDTGAQGRYVENIVAGFYGSIQYSLFQDTGPGRIDVTVFTDNANVPAHSSFVVPQ